MLAALSFAVGCTDDGVVVVDDGELTVINESDFVIEEIYLTEIDNPDWGPNLLRDGLFPGEDLFVGVPCGYYDALLVDEDGVECTLYDLDLCFNDATWIIENNTCTAWNAARKAREQAAAEAVQAPPADAAAN